MKHYSLRAFLRATENSLLSRYFQTKGILAEIDFSKLTPYKVEPVFEAIENLPKTQRQQVDADFQDIHAMSYEGGVSLLLSEGRHQDTNFAEAFELLKGHESKAFWAFLSHRAIFDTALQLSCRDNLTGHWKTRRGLPPVEAAEFTQRTKALEKALGAHLRNIMGKGKGCTVDYIGRDSQHFFFAYPEGHSRTILHYRDSQLRRDYFSPALEMIFVYDMLAGSLEMYFSGGRENIADFQEIFGQTILRIKSLPLDVKPTFDLEPLKRRDFRFVYPADSGITDVSVTELKSAHAEDGIYRTIGLAVSGKGSSENVYDMLDTHVPVIASQGRPARANTRLKSVHIRVGFAPKAGRKRPGSRTFYINDPDGTNLRHDERDTLIRQMLKNSKLMADDAGAERQAA